MKRIALLWAVAALLAAALACGGESDDGAATPAADTGGETQDAAPTETPDAGG